MTDAEIHDLAVKHHAAYDEWQIDLYGFARALLAAQSTTPSESFEEWASEEGINNFHFNHCHAAWQAALASNKAAAVAVGESIWDAAYKALTGLYKDENHGDEIYWNGFNVGIDAAIHEMQEILESPPAAAQLSGMLTNREALERCAENLEAEYKGSKTLSPVTVLDCVDFIRSFEVKL
jgi:hypothetical protein